MARLGCAEATVRELEARLRECEAASAALEASCALLEEQRATGAREAAVGAERVAQLEAALAARDDKVKGVAFGGGDCGQRLVWVSRVQPLAATQPARNMGFTRAAHPHLSRSPTSSACARSCTRSWGRQREGRCGAQSPRVQQHAQRACHGGDCNTHAALAIEWVLQTRLNPHRRPPLLPGTPAIPRAGGGPPGARARAPASCSRNRSGACAQVRAPLPCDAGSLPQPQHQLESVPLTSTPLIGAAVGPCRDAFDAAEREVRIAREMRDAAQDEAAR